MESKPSGLVVCGGKSHRMGIDKGLIAYHGKPQREYVYEMLEGLCDRVFMSCNADQAKSMNPRYQALVDLPAYENIGPMAALLTAFAHRPDSHFIVVGCDYPFVTAMDISNFLRCIDPKMLAATFYNQEFSLYEPLLGWYSKKSKSRMLRMFGKRQYSLQHFLNEYSAQRYEPARPEVTESVDTPEDYEKAKGRINNKDQF